MRFAGDDNALRGQLIHVHPQVLAVLREFELFSQRSDLPEPCITDLLRTKKQQGDIYFRIITANVARIRAGLPIISDAERECALKAVGLPPDGIRKIAEEKFSWHLVGCAADLRTIFYRPVQLIRVVEWFRHNCPSPIWEVRTEDHGTGRHIHFGFRDFSTRKQREKEAASNA